MIGTMRLFASLKSIRSRLPLALIVGLGVGITCFSCQPQLRFNGQAVKPPVPAPALTGTNWNGELFDLANLHGKVVVLFFGYTSCPDVCPLTLAKMKQVDQALGPKAQDVDIVFVSVDPKRDSVAKLAEYVPNFDRRFYGVRVEKDPLDKVADDYHLTIQYGQPQGNESFYYVDHTGTYFVIDRQGRLRLTYSPKTAAKTIVPDLEKLLAG